MGIHGTLWLDIKEIEKSTEFRERNKGNGNLSDAFKKFRDEKELSEEEKDAIETFTDMFVSCSLNSKTIHEDKEAGEKIINIIKAVNCHNCTNPCEKYGEKCKYGFPRYPLKRT